MLILSLTDGRSGNRRQADALAEALAGRLQFGWAHYTVRPRLPWSLWAPRWGWATQAGFDPGLIEQLDRLRPALVIGCGRQAALATRIAKRRVGARSVQILDPRIDSADWDVCVQPRHDPERNSRTVRTLGSIHPVTPLWLEAQRQSRPALGKLAAPRHLILLGGPTRHCRYGRAEAQQWLSELRTSGTGSRLIIGSRRSPEWLRQTFSELPADLHWWDDADGDNPYAAALAWADCISLSPDSVNMISEAAASSAALRLLPVTRVDGRLAAFHQALHDSGRLVDSADGASSATATPWSELGQVVEEIIERLFSDVGASKLRT